MKIKCFRIDGLFDKYSFQSKFDKRVNIIVGNNGTYKSTVLDILRYVIWYGDVPSVDFRTASISFTNGMEVTSATSDFSINKSGYDMGLHVRHITKNEIKITSEEYLKGLKFDYISTFDIKDKDINTQETLLDKRLVKLQSDYGYYLNGLLKQLTGSLNALGNITKKQFEQIYKRKDLFIKLVNDAFKETGKVIDNNAEKLRFILDDNTTIGANKLSSGEKQLLIILLTALLEDGQEFILMMDEPEISLHISWQYQLLNWIQLLNPNVQLILTTHSPSIFSDGWGEKAIYMEDITKVAQ